jgi:hypothetical protein
VEAGFPKRSRTTKKLERQSIQSETIAPQSMIPKSGNRLSEKIMLKRSARALERDDDWRQVITV